MILQPPTIASAHNSLRIEWVPIAALRRNPRNPRRHGDRQRRLLKQSIKAFGFISPVIADDDGYVLAGHARLDAAEELGMQEVPVLRVSALSPEQAKAFAIADNRLTEIAAWDDRLLGEILSELATIDLDFNLEATGFTTGEIDLKIEALADDEEGRDPADDFSDVSEGPAVAQGGDLFLLGKHKIFCGDAVVAASYRTLMAGQRAAVVFTDVPYNVPIRGHVSGRGKKHHREFVRASGEMSDAEYAAFLAKALKHLAANSLDGSIHFQCIDWRHVFAMLMAGQRAYTELKNVCVWEKNNAGMGSLYRSQHELVCVFKNGHAPHRNNIQLGRFGRSRTNVWRYPSANTFGRSGDEGNLRELHPTVKPVALIADAIMDCSARGEIVLDAFLGSGSTLIAAERVGRICYGMELDPLYVDTAIRRWQRHSGDSAILARTGQRFDEIAAKPEAKHG